MSAKKLAPPEPKYWIGDRVRFRSVYARRADAPLITGVIMSISLSMLGAGDRWYVSYTVVRDDGCSPQGMSERDIVGLVQS